MLYINRKSHYEDIWYSFLGYCPTMSKKIKLKAQS
nr:MAG TPA: hypothetical protein [Caudoviricetes sp.]